MNVCGVLVHARPDQIDAVEAGIAAIPGVEAHGRSKGARLVVTVEDSDGLSAADALGRLNAVPGVVAAALVYHEFDPQDEEASTRMEDEPC